MAPYLGPKFIKDLIIYCTKEVGPNWTRQFWRNSEFKWTQFMPAKDVDQFVKENVIFCMFVDFPSYNWCFVSRNSNFLITRI